MTLDDVAAPTRDTRVLRNLRRLDRYIISAPVLMIVVIQLGWPVLGLFASTDTGPVWRLIVAGLAAAGLTVAELIMMFRLLPVVRAGGYGLPRRQLIAWVAVLVPLLVLTGLAPAMRSEGAGAGWPPIVAMSTILGWAVISMAYSLLVAAIGAVVIVLIFGGYAVAAGAMRPAADGDLGAVLGAVSGIAYGFWAFFLIAAFWGTAWMLRVVMEVHRSRQIAAELAIAEERLRFSRDVHDVFGRTLATVALKSELAEGLARRGRVEQAAKEMAAVRQLADDTGREVRGLVRGYREADLGRELAGAQTLLDSAGIRCQVAGSALLEQRRLDQQQTTALAWVLREGVTNIIRHSRATSVLIDFSGTDPVTMMITNDGSDRPAGPDTGTGTGLQSMAARLAETGGSFQYRQHDDHFIVSATVPAGSTVRQGDR